MLVAKRSACALVQVKQSCAADRRRVSTAHLLANVGLRAADRQHGQHAIAGHCVGCMRADTARAGVKNGPSEAEMLHLSHSPPLLARLTHIAHTPGMRQSV